MRVSITVEHEPHAAAIAHRASGHALLPEPGRTLYLLSVAPRTDDGLHVELVGNVPHDEGAGDVATLLEALAATLRETGAPTSTPTTTITD